MADKRMFSNSVVGTDKFADMSPAAQLAYFYLGLHGDDDGFVDAPKRILRSVGCDAAALNELVQAGYLFQFESGVVLIVHWHQNNTLKNDRYKPTVYQEELAQVVLNDRKVYVMRGNEVEPSRNQGGSLTKQNITEQNITQREREPRADAHAREKDFEIPNREAVRTYFAELGREDLAESFADYYEARGWMMGNSPMRNWKAAARRWLERETPTPAAQSNAPYAAQASAARNPQHQQFQRHGEISPMGLAAIQRLLREMDEHPEDYEEDEPTPNCA